MQDTAFGWTIEMQIKALQQGLRITEVPVRLPPADWKVKNLRDIVGSSKAGKSHFCGRSSSMPGSILIFIKGAVAGFVKTRLTPELTPQQAAELYKAMAQDTFRVVEPRSPECPRGRGLSNPTRNSWTTLAL